MDKFVKENGENQLFTVNLKRPSLYLHQFMQGSGFVQPDMAGWVEEAKSLPSSVQYEKNLAYKGFYKTKYQTRKGKRTTKVREERCV